MARRSAAAGWTVGLVGNPNSGKTTVFNALTGANQRVGNWPGVTVERKEGRYRHDGREFAVVDLPGVYSLDAEGGEIGPDERVAQDYLASGEADLILNVVDASNLERNLYLTVQVAEMGLPMVVALNMVDVAEGRGLRVEADALSERLGCPVVPTNAARGRGLRELRDAVGRQARAPSRPRVRVAYPPAVEAAISRLKPAVAGKDEVADEGAGARWTAVKLLEGDDGAGPDGVPGRLAAEERRRVQQELDEDVDILIADGRYGHVRGLVEGVTERAGEVGATVSERLDRVVLNRWLGIPVFLAAMYLMFMFTINVGGAFIDFFDVLAGAVFVEGFGAALAALGAPGWLVVLLADGAGGGVQTVATFIPIVGVLFLFLSVLEDSGYMARAAFVVDRFMRFVGLPGKSFVPLLLGFGCNVPAIMATRTLESRRDRLLTIMMNPFMSCGARLPVYALFAAAFFP